MALHIPNMSELPILIMMVLAPLVYFGLLFHWFVSGCVVIHDSHAHIVRVSHPLRFWAWFSANLVIAIVLAIGVCALLYSIIVHGT